MEKIIAKIAKINKLRVERRKAGEDLDEADYEFDYLLLCNKICGQSHYNMQMKIVVDTPEDYAAWLKAQPRAKDVITVAAK